MSALVEARGLSMPGRLSRVSLDIGAGELVALIGPNGSGKTSLLHAMAAIGSPEGEVRIAGIEPSGLPPSARIRIVGYLPATREVAWPLTARDLVALSGAKEGEVDEAIAALALEDVAGRRVDRLSTGERSRVLIARALAPSPSLLLLDEPSANLDPLWQLHLFTLLRKALGAGEDRAAVVALHDLDLASRFADRLILVDGGRMVASGRPAEILSSRALVEAFGVERVNGRWEVAVRPKPADRQSSP